MIPSMPAQTGMTVVKKFPYRGDPTEEFSNTYWFTGTVPANDTEFLALFNALVAQEKTVYSADVTIIRGYGYNDNTGHRSTDPPGTDVAPSVWTRDLVAASATVPGTLVPTGGAQQSGDTAVWARWKTSRRTNPGGKAIYLRKYFHDVFATISGSAADQVLPAQKSALLAFAAKMWDGTFIDARKITAAGQTDVILGANASSYVTTRTLKRRGKRPGT